MKFLRWWAQVAPACAALLAVGCDSSSEAPSDDAGGDSGRAIAADDAGDEASAPGEDAGKAADAETTSDTDASADAGGPSGAMDAGEAGSTLAEAGRDAASNQGSSVDAGSDAACMSSCVPASCVGMAGNECRGEDCCSSLPVSGGTFQQGEPDAFASTVASFRLDAFEVTVGRFRRFVAAYDAWLAAGHPKSGAGQNAHVDGSGWNSAWRASLPADASALKAQLTCGHGNHTWAESGHDTLPINCVDWYTALAFCLWDGGRLPTESEAEYAAAGGSNDYRYPWGESPVLTDMQDSSATYAVYLCLADGTAPNVACSPEDIVPVGSKPSGRGYYKQYDLVGSVWEWSLDWYQDTFPTTAQQNFAKLDDGKYRVVRGGSWDNTAKLVHAASRTGMTPTTRYDTVGVRCARD